MYFIGVYITCIGDFKKKLMNDDNKHITTIANIITVVFANNVAPIKQINKFKKFNDDVYENLHQCPSFNIELPAGIK